MTTKADWIRQQSVELKETNANSLYSLLKDLVEIANPTEQGTVLKPIGDFSAIGLSANDRKIIQNELQGTYQSLLLNIQKGLLQSIADDIEVLCLSISEDGAAKIEAAMAEAIAGMPDPNWQPTIKVTRYGAAGYESLTYKEVFDALA
jgi:hypothetical protein